MLSVSNPSTRNVKSLNCKIFPNGDLSQAPSGIYFRHGFALQYLKSNSCQRQVRVATALSQHALSGTLHVYKSKYKRVTPVARLRHSLHLFHRAHAQLQGDQLHCEKYARSQTLCVQLCTCLSHHHTAMSDPNSLRHVEQVARPLDTAINWEFETQSSRVFS